MKKLVSIVLTTGLLMGTVACGAGERDRDRSVPQQKKVVVVQERERKQPVMKRVRLKPGKKLVVKVRAKKRGVVKVAVKPVHAWK
jgi:D-lyxose ketol-isomerase